MALAFVERDREDDAFARFAENPKFVRNDAPIFNCDARSHSLHRRFCRPDRRRHVVFLVQLVAGVHDAVGDFTVVRE